MVIYLDMCCLKRPFDDQAQPRVRLESEAVLAMLAVESAKNQFLRSSALGLENSFNPVKDRAAKVDQWLRERPWPQIETARLQQRIAQLMGLGFKNFDALHLATAEISGATVFASCDDKLLSNAKRNAHQLFIRVVGVVELAKEVLSDPSAP